MIDANQRAMDKIAVLATRGLDLVSFWRESADVIATAVPFFAAPCWYTLDPASLLVTSHFNEHMKVLPPERLAGEYFGDDVNKLVDVARSETGVATLHEATGGQPANSPRWHANMMLGGDQEMIGCLRSTSGEVWGALGLYREPDRPLFNGAEVAFVRSVAPQLADGARRGLLLGEAIEPDRPDAPGLIVVNDRWEIESATPGVERWLAELTDVDLATGQLPASILAVAGRALSVATGRHQPGEIAVSRVRSRSGGWLMLHGTSLISSTSRRVAVIVEPAHPARITPLLMAAYGLTEREQDVTRLVLQGDSTTEIAEKLIISAGTVQQHLTSIFEKTGVRSRRDLVGKVFFMHYEPRVRDNENRAKQGKPLRGGPFESTDAG